jgi:putative endonuclease
MLRCADDSLYTGITIDLEKRLGTHNAAKGARYTASRLPVKLVWHKAVKDKSAALKEELALKSLSRAEKLKLINL